MPLEIALLPMVESAFNPNATSVARASGIWQFMPATGTHYGLKQNFWFDSRRDVVAATEGALTYLRSSTATSTTGSSRSPATTGVKATSRAPSRRTRRRACPTDYADLKMPDETRNYLPKLQALKNIVRDPEKYGLDLGDIPDAPYFAVVRMTPEDRREKAAAELAEMPLDEFQYLNPQHNRPVIAGADEYTILLPIDKAEVFAAKLELADQPLVSWQAYRMRNGETLPQVAAKFGLSVEVLRAVNGIGAKARVPAGHALLVPTQGPDRGRRGDAVEGRVHDGSAGPHVLLPGEPRRLRSRASPRATRWPRGPAALERACQNQSAVAAGPDAAHHERSRAGRGKGKRAAGSRRAGEEGGAEHGEEGGAERGKTKGAERGDKRPLDGGRMPGRHEACAKAPGGRRRRRGRCRRLTRPPSRGGSRARPARMKTGDALRVACSWIAADRGRTLLPRNPYFFAAFFLVAFCFGAAFFLVAFVAFFFGAAFFLVGLLLGGLLLRRLLLRAFFFVVFFAAFFFVVFFAAFFFVVFFAAFFLGAAFFFVSPSSPPSSSAPPSSSLPSSWCRFLLRRFLGRRSRSGRRHHRHHVSHFVSPV